jgi:imidazole glycerol-phosphate synthase subunit HisH
MIAVVDYEMGNIGSLMNMFRKIGATAVTVSQPDELLAADQVVLPGVGAFPMGIERLRSRGFAEAIRAFVASGRPLLGICLGMQLLTRRSEEGGGDGLDLIPAATVRLRPGNRLPVPHMGWNTVAVRRHDPLFSAFDEAPRFYFVHSFHVACDDPDLITAEATYGAPFAAAVASGNVMGVQFHPEKSHRYGMALLRSFAAAR